MLQHQRILHLQDEVELNYNIQKISYTTIFQNHNNIIAQHQTNLIMVAHSKRNKKMKLQVCSQICNTHNCSAKYGDVTIGCRLINGEMVRATQLCSSAPTVVGLNYTINFRHFNLNQHESFWVGRCYFCTFPLTSKGILEFVTIETCMHFKEKEQLPHVGHNNGDFTLRRKGQEVTENGKLHQGFR